MNVCLNFKQIGYYLKMQSVEEFRKNFDKVYYNVVLRLIAPLEEERKLAFLKCVLAAICAFVVGIVTLYLIVNSSVIFKGWDSDAVELILTPPGLLFLFLCYLPFGISKSFENKIKEKIMPIFLKGLGSFNWSENGVLTDSFINDTRLFADYNRRFDDESFKGTYKDVDIYICETELGKKTGSGKNSSYTVRFKGVLVGLFPKKRFSGTTLIKKRGLVNFTPSGLEEVNLEDVEFEKRFNVYSTDQIEARYVLTTAFMERFKNIGFAFKSSKIEASLQSSGILIAVSVSRDLFKVAKVYKPICDYQQFKSMIEEFASVLELIDELKLNQNIGL